MTSFGPGHPALPDPGLQPERTALSWRRTSLSLLLCSLAGTRLVGPVLGWWSLPVGLVGVSTAVWVERSAGRRCESVSRHLSGCEEAADSTLPDALLLALTAGVVLGAAVLGAGYVLWACLSRT